MHSAKRSIFTASTVATVGMDAAASKSAASKPLVGVSLPAFFTSSLTHCLSLFVCTRSALWIACLALARSVLAPAVTDAMFFLIDPLKRYNASLCLSKHFSSFWMSFSEETSMTSERIFSSSSGSGRKRSCLSGTSATVPARWGVEECQVLPGRVFVIL